MHNPFPSLQKPTRPGKFTRQDKKADRDDNGSRTRCNQHYDSHQNNRCADNSDDDLTRNWPILQADGVERLSHPPHVSLYRNRAMLQLRRELGEFLTEFGRNVRNNNGVAAFIFQFEHVADPVDFRDQRRFACRNFEVGAQSPGA